MPACPTSGGYSAVARHLTQVFALDPPLDRRQVYDWARRRTVNAAGHTFPRPAAELPAAPCRPRLVWHLGEVAWWYRGGPPGRRGS